MENSNTKEHRYKVSKITSVTAGSDSMYSLLYWQKLGQNKETVEMAEKEALSA